MTNNDNMKKAINLAGRGAARTGEFAVSEMALPAAALTASSGVAENGYVSNIIDGLYRTGSIVANATGAYVWNEGVRDTLNGAALEAMKSVGDLGYNLAERPAQTLAAALTVYCLFKSVPYASRAIRGKMQKTETNV